MECYSLIKAFLIFKINLNDWEMLLFREKLKYYETKVKYHIYDHPHGNFAFFFLFFFWGGGYTLSSTFNPVKPNIVIRFYWTIINCETNIIMKL